MLLLSRVRLTRAHVWLLFCVHRRDVSGGILLFSFVIGVFISFQTGFVLKFELRVTAATVDEL